MNESKIRDEFGLLFYGVGIKHTNRMFEERGVKPTNVIERFCQEMAVKDMVEDLIEVVVEYHTSASLPSPSLKETE